MTKLPNDKVIEYAEWGGIPREKAARMANILILFFDGIGKRPLKPSEKKLSPNEQIGIVFLDRVLQAIYFSAVEGYHLNNLALPNGKRPLELAKQVFEEHSKRKEDGRFNFLEPMKEIMRHLNHLEVAYAEVKGDKTDFIAQIEKKYADILGVGTAEGLEKEPPFPPTNIPSPPALEQTNSQSSWERLAKERQDRKEPKRGSGDGKPGNWLD